MQDKKFLVQEWIKRADDDELNICSVLKHRDGTPANVCFLSQQMAEKYLKALLLLHSGEYPRTHDLSKLVTLLNNYVSLIAEDLKEDIILLAPYYIATRYPADIPIETFSWKMADEASKAAANIKKLALKNLA